jgi:spermidine synthase
MILQRLISGGKIGEYMLVYPAVLINGAIILVIEILGTRILAPFYGTTLYVWASMISTTLIFLSLGYFLGGALADRKPVHETFYLVLLAAGLSLLPIPLLSKKVLLFTDPLGPRLGALASSILLFSVQFTLLGSIAPYAIRLKTKRVKTTGITAGGLYGIATIGSFLGALLAGFYLVPNFGIRTIIYLSSLSLIVLPAAWFIGQKRYKAPLLLFLIFLLYSINMGFSEIRPEEVLFKTEGLYGQIKVVKKNNKLFMLVNGGVQTCVEDEKPCSRYIYTMAYSTAFFQEFPENFLVLGHGGGSLEEGLLKSGVATDIVEIDPTVGKVAAEYFNFSGHVVIEDARRFVRNSEKRYDLIFQDLYNYYIPATHLHTLESFQETKSILEDDGIFVLNTLGSVASEDSIVQRSIYTTLKQVFSNVYVLPLDEKKSTNVVFFASERRLDLPSYELGEGGIVLTDEYNPLEFWAINVAEKGREETLNYFGSEVLLS